MAKQPERLLRPRLSATHTASMSARSNLRRGPAAPASPTLVCVASAIDSARAMRAPGELLTLVRAVLGALPKDELDWIEWKCDGDLADKGTQGTIARHILGMANRLPGTAALHAQGCGSW